MGNGSQFMRLTERGPWNIPQSTRTVLVDVVTKKREPVTVPAAPRKVISTAGQFLMTLPSGPRLMGLPPRVTMGGGSRSRRNCSARMTA